MHDIKEAISMENNQQMINISKQIESWGVQNDKIKK